MLGIVARAAANVAPEEEDGEDGGVRGASREILGGLKER